MQVCRLADATEIGPIVGTCTVKNKATQVAESSEPVRLNAEFSVVSSSESRLPYSHLIYALLYAAKPTSGIAAEL